MKKVHDTRIIMKYVPIRQMYLSEMSSSGSAFSLSKDSYFSIFPALLEYQQYNPFEVFTVEERFKWCAFFIEKEIQVLGIADSFDLLIDCLKALDYNAPSWYTNVVKDNEKFITDCVMRSKTDIILYTKLQHEYGFCQGESKTDKSLLFPKSKSNLYEAKIVNVLKQALIMGNITKEDYENYLKYAKRRN